MDPDDNSNTPDSVNSIVTSSPNPQNPVQPSIDKTPDLATSTSSLQSPAQDNLNPNTSSENPTTQSQPKYPAFERVRSYQSAPVMGPQQTSTSTETQAHYNSQQDAHVVQSTAQSPKPKGSKKKLMATLILALFLLGTIGTSVFAWSVAYNKLTLGDNNVKTELAIKQVVYSLPFVKKPPEYLLAKTVKAHQDVTRESFDISVAIGSDELADPLGISQLDFQIKGGIDYTDPKNIFFNTEIFLTKGLNIELRKKEKTVYFNVKDIPSFLLAFAGMSKSQFEPVLNKWVAWDTTPLDTEARRTITDQETNYLNPEFSNDFFSEHVDDYLLQRLTVTDAEVDGHTVYKIALNADKEMIDYIQRKLEDSSNDTGKFSVLGYTADSPKMSDFIKTLVAEIYIDKSSYYTRKVILSATVEYDSEELSGLGLGIVGGTGNSSATFAFAAKFDKFGEAVVVEEPIVEMDSEKFIEEVSKIVSEIFGNMYSGNGEISGSYSPVSSANNARRKADLEQIRAGLELYRADCNLYPKTLGSLLSVDCANSISGQYLSVIPKDPDGSSYYYQSNITTYDLCANLINPYEAQTTCPDPSYNYHISSSDL